MKQATLCFLFKSDSLLLGFKKTGFGEGNYNGFGGKLKEGETPLQAACREVKEECGITLAPGAVRGAGMLLFRFPHDSENDMLVHVFACDSWNGEPIETQEMKPELFDAKTLPFAKMWADDPYWLPELVAGKRMTGEFTFNPDNTVKSHLVTEAGSWR